LQRFLGLTGMAKAELQLGDAGPAETEIRGNSNGLVGGLKSVAEVATRLVRVRLSKPFAGEFGIGVGLPFLKLYCNDELPECIAEAQSARGGSCRACRLADRVEYLLGLCNVADSEE